MQEFGFMALVVVPWEKRRKEDVDQQKEKKSKKCEAKMSFAEKKKQEARFHELKWERETERV